MKSVQLNEIIEEMNLKNYTPEIDIAGIKITIPDINRLSSEVLYSSKHPQALEASGNFLSIFRILYMAFYGFM
jgi:hypothetical protein